MDITNENANNTTENEEDDYGNYFLQPASSPYDIAEKLKEANTALFDENLIYIEKDTRVKFKEDLVDYEPELSCNETSSIEESDDNLDYSLMEDTIVLETQLQTALILNTYNSDDDDNDEDNCELEEEEEIIEEINDDLDTLIYVNNHDDIDFNVHCEKVDDMELTISPVKSEDSDGLKFNIKRTPNKNKNRFLKKSNPIQIVSCRKHCIDNVDNFDFQTNISIQKINLVENPHECPRLKLQPRDCCEKNEIKNQQKLPCYTGLRSEYGLNAAQLEKRERIKRLIKLRYQEKQQIIEENKKRKLEQNEEIFCQWLKAVSSRKTYERKSSGNKHTMSSTVISFPNKHTEPIRHRPKTTNDTSIKHIIRKLPRSSSACVFVEVPQNVLKNGIKIGDLLITETSKMVSKKLHVLSIT